MRKILAALLALALVLALVPAVMAEGAAEPITLTVFRGDPGDQPTADNKIYKLIEEKFGVTFKFEYLAGDLDEKLGMMIAGEDYPDLFDGGNSADLIISNGALINLLDYVSPEKTPRLWAHIEPQKARLIENFLAKHPTREDGTPYTGFAILCEDWRHFCLINKDTFVMNYDQYIAAISSGTILGMFDQAWDFGTATSALLDAKMFENTYVALGPVYSEKDIEGVAMPTEGWKIEEHYLNGSLPNVRRGFGISTKCTCPERIVAMWEEMMSDEWQLLFNWGVEGEDYSITDEGRLSMTEEQYYNTQDANWKLANKAEAFTQSSPKKQGWIMNDIQVGDKVVKAGNCWEPGNQDEIVLGLMNDYDKEFLGHYGYSKWADFVNPPIELAPFGEAWQIDYSPVDVEHTDFCAIQDKDLPELIMCDPAEFDAKWDAFVEEITPSAKVFQDYMQEHVVIEAHKVLDNK